MRIDNSNLAVQTFASPAEVIRSAPSHTQTHAEPVAVNLSSLTTTEADARVTTHTAGLITGNINNALAAHNTIDPERAMRLAGLLED